MASIRKRGNKWQVQVRRKGQPPQTRSFNTKSDAQAWARYAELETDRLALPYDRRCLDALSLGDLVKRYRDTVTPRKKDAEGEAWILNAFLRHPICAKPISQVTPADFASYRDERLAVIQASTFNRQLVPLHNLFRIAKVEWGL